MADKNLSDYSANRYPNFTVTQLVEIVFGQRTLPNESELIRLEAQELEKFTPEQLRQHAAAALTRALILRSCFTHLLKIMADNNAKFEEGWAAVKEMLLLQPSLVKESQAILGARAKLEKDPKQAAKKRVRELWANWQAGNPPTYTSGAKFAFDMANQFDLNQKVVEKWITTWNRQ